VRLILQSAHMLSTIAFRIHAFVFAFPLYLIVRAPGIAASVGRLRSGQRDHGVQSDDAGTSIALARRHGVIHGIKRTGESFTHYLLRLCVAPMFSRLV
jgi:hypothetical protein